ncbi:uncharacterized protein K02A2.6-like [Pollicipes pollicipes]|uniref:uncharacterized protein K02A2.6-like n=1 Tax=Pollicipes pollicipes TaxID=41117 RepID=UPI0018850EA9|nr:uncharacterized protein K02A2.6-like [Pollicipes pollicipes]
MQDLLEQLQGDTVFSSLNLKSACHQLELHPDSRSLTTFIIHQGLMRYKRCPYGLKSLPQAFQKVMEAVPRGINGVQVYLDDVIIFAQTPSQHEVQLSAVMERLRRRRITLNMDKCRMRQRKVEFLGFIVSQQGVAVNLARAQALRDLPPPSGLKDLQIMLGLFGFYSRFVPSSSTLVEPLRRLLRKGAPPFLWTPDLQAVMDAVRQGILKSQALAMYDPSLPTLVTTDASDVGVGAVLSQLHSQGERVVSFASCSLNPAQRRYSVTEPGEEGDVEDDVVAVAAVTAQLEAVQRDELLSATGRDPVLRQLTQQIPRQWPRRRRDCSEQLQPFFHCREELSLVGDLVVRGQRVVVPPALRPRMVALAHEGHQGIVRPKQRARDLYWWPKMDAEIEDAVTNCEVCAALDKSANTRSTPLQPVPLPETAWDKVGLDFIGPMEAPRQQRFAVVLIDYYSKWIEVGFCAEPSTEAAVQFLETLASPLKTEKQAVSESEVRRRMENRQAYHKAYADGRSGARTPPFDVGDQVRQLLKYAKRGQRACTIRQDIRTADAGYFKGRTLADIGLAATPVCDQWRIRVVNEHGDANELQSRDAAVQIGRRRRREPYWAQH